MELVAVLLILGIVSAAAAPKFFASLQYHRVESAARRMKLDLELARHAACESSQPRTITFTSSSIYTLSAEVAGLDRASQNYVVDLTAEPYLLERVTLNLGGPTSIVFDGYGNASAGGTIRLEAGDDQRTITIDAATGRVSITSP